MINGHQLHSTLRYHHCHNHRNHSNHHHRRNDDDNVPTDQLFKDVLLSTAQLDV